MAARDALTERSHAAVDAAIAADHPVIVPVGVLDAPLPARVGVFAGTFDPLTRAHAAVAHAASDDGCGLVLIVVPVVSVDKEHLARDPDGVVRRLAAVDAWAQTSHGRFAAATTNAGLYVDIAVAADAALPGAHVDLVCGADKVAQIFDPTYYDGDRDRALDRLFAHAGLLAVPRGDVADVTVVGDDRVRWLALDDAFRHHSASDVRSRRDAGEDVSHLLV